LLFSRYLNASDWRTVLPRSRTELSALVVISNPAGLDRYEADGHPLGAIDVQEEQAAARELALRARAARVSSQGRSRPRRHSHAPALASTAIRAQ